MPCSSDAKADLAGVRGIASPLSLCVLIACLDASSRPLLRWRDHAVDAHVQAQGEPLRFPLRTAASNGRSASRSKRMRIVSRRMVPLALAGLASLAISAAVVAAQASEFPNKPVTLIVPFQAGISVDILLRGIAEVAGQHLGQAVVIDNKAGGSATLGPAHMASYAKPDGYTIAHIPFPVLRVPHMQKVT